MSKSVYFFITILLGVNCWNLIILGEYFNGVTNPVFAVVWALFGFYVYRRRPGHEKIFDFSRYHKYFLWLVVGFTLSVVSANMFWNQSMATGLVADRFLIWYMYIPVLFYIQSSEKEIIKALRYYAIAYFIVWVIQALTPYPIFSSLASSIEIGRGKWELAQTDFGQLLPGYPIILILLYFEMQQLIEKADFKNSLRVLILIGFFFLLQNRGSLFFAVIVFGITLFRIRSNKRILILSLFAVIIAIAYFYSAPHWNALISETVEQVNDPLSNRWMSFNLFIFHYSPHWMCNILGNGLLSSNVPAGRIIQDLMDQGYYQYDNGLVGFWSQYGIIPLMVLYTVILTILFRKQFPFYLKAIAAHILFVPIVWNFGVDDIIIFVLLIYLFAYNREMYRVTYPAKSAHVVAKGAYNRIQFADSPSSRLYGSPLYKKSS